MLAAGAPGALAVVTDAGERRFNRALTAGYADLASKRPISALDRFRVASVTKTFAATVVLQLAAEKRLDLDRPIVAYLPAGTLPAGWKQTTRQLLRHRGGLYDHGDDLLARGGSDTVTNFEQHIRRTVYTPKQLVEASLGHGLQSAPGTAYLYSNTDFVLAQLAAEQVTGVPFRELLYRRILRPLGLRSTSYVVPDPRITGRHVTGYLTQDDRSKPLVDSTEQNMSWMVGAGAIISTAGDLHRFHRALLGGRLMPAAQLAQMREVLPTGSKFKKSSYGLGLKDYTLSCGVHVVGHDGVIQGFQTQLYSTPDARRQLVVFGNASNNGAVYDAELGALEPVFCGKAAAPVGLRVVAGPRDTDLE